MVKNVVNHRVLDKSARWSMTLYAETLACVSWFESRRLLVGKLRESLFDET